jgi:cytoskeletal protein CcmA (bactofilin family)
MIVEGEINVAGSVLAEKITVMPNGRMTVGRLNAACIEVSPGGLLQGLIEKYVPRRAPAEGAGAPREETEDEAEAA